MAPNVRAAATRVVSSVSTRPKNSMATHAEKGVHDQAPRPLTEQRLRQINQVNLGWKAQSSLCGVIAKWEVWRAVGDALEQLAAAEKQGLLALDELVTLVGDVDACWLKLIMELNGCFKVFRSDPVMTEGLSLLHDYLHDMMDTVYDIYHVVNWGSLTSKDQAYRRVVFSLSAKQRQTRSRHNNAAMGYALDDINRDPTLFKEWQLAYGPMHNLLEQGESWPKADYSADVEFRSELPSEPNVSVVSEYVQKTEDAIMAAARGDGSFQVPYAPQPDKDLPDPMGDGSLSDTTTAVDEIEDDDGQCLSNDVDSDSCSEEWAVVSSNADTIIVDQDEDEDEDGQSVWSLSDSELIRIDDQDGKSSCSLDDWILDLDDGSSNTIREEGVNSDLDRLWYEYFYQSTSLLDNWQRLLADLGQTGDFSSVRKCKKAMRGIWVDPGEFLAAKRKPEDVRLYRSERHLASSLANRNCLASLQTSSRHPALSSMKAKVKRHVRCRSRACGP